MAAEVGEKSMLLDERYRLGTCVGEGGMARVYRADDVALGRTVALKLIRPGVDGDVSARARTEVTLLASLNHPSLVTLFDARLDPGRPEYLVMEFVAGPTLADRLSAGGALTPEDAAHLAGELAEALHVVHAAGIVHRDIKPSNVLLSPSTLPGGRPRAKLADFGIAYLLDASRLTSPGLVIGTVAYLSPEQIRGGEPAAASDVYSLGLVLLEALTGQRAHPHGGGMAAALARLENPPAIPETLGARWRELLAGMLHRDPSRRPSAADVALTAHRLAAPGTQSLAAADATGATDATVPLTAATLVAPGVAVAAAAASVPGASTPDGAMTEARDRPRRRGRLVAIAAGGAVLAAVLGAGAVVGLTTLAPANQIPAPVVTVPTDPPQPSDDADDVVVEDTGVTEEERKAAEEARKKAEEAQKKAAEEARKQAEEEQKKLEEEQKKSEDGDG